MDFNLLGAANLTDYLIAVRLNRTTTVFSFNRICISWCNTRILEKILISHTIHYTTRYVFNTLQDVYLPPELVYYIFYPITSALIQNSTIVTAINTLSCKSFVTVCCRGMLREPCTMVNTGCRHLPVILTCGAMFWVNYNFCIRCKVTIVHMITLFKEIVRSVSISSSLFSNDLFCSINMCCRSCNCEDWKGLGRISRWIRPDILNF